MIFFFKIMHVACMILSTIYQLLCMHHVECTMIHVFKYHLFIKHQYWRWASPQDVTVSSSLQFFSKTALRIFLIFCTNVLHDKRKKRARRFVQKNFGSSTKYENVVKKAVFRLFLQDYSNDFAHFFSECAGERYRSAEKNRLSKSCFVLEIFTVKVCF